METLFKKHRALISQVSMKIVRQLMNTISWEKQRYQLLCVVHIKHIIALAFL